MNITSRKKKGYYTYSLRVREILCLWVGVRSLPLVTPVWDFWSVLFGGHIMKRIFSSTLGAFCFSKCLTSFYFFLMILDKYHPQKIK
jgi:hypothetical protein